MSKVIWDASYNPAVAENGKFVVLSSAALENYPVTGLGKYALLTYEVNPPNITLSAGTVIVPSIVSAHQDGAWSVYQAGTWDVNSAQKGNWTVNAAQSGNWIASVAQSGNWDVNAIQKGAWSASVAQSGNWLVSSILVNPIKFTETYMDAFGRLRISSPMTLFDSNNRYSDNNCWATLTAEGGTYNFNSNQGLMELAVTTASGSSVIRETYKVFSYQPGKSLLVINTFVFDSSATNLRQRCGYFGSDNGIYIQLDDNTLSFVKRTSISGSVAETIVTQSNWNIDPLDGTGPSGITLDITKAQIMWMDIEWLGVGTVRTGFVIDGQFIHCHSFHHANKIASTYITTASLPLRYEIYNKNTTSTSHTMKQICSTVISEGGYELRGLQQSVNTDLLTPRDLTNKGTYYPVISIRLKSTRKDAIAIVTAINAIAKENGYFQWRLVQDGVTSGGTWTSAGTHSSVEYSLDSTAYTGGQILASGFFKESNQVSMIVDLSGDSLFKTQLKRDTLNGVNKEIILAIASDTDSRDVLASIDWEEISR